MYSDDSLSGDQDLSRYRMTSVLLWLGIDRLELRRLRADLCYKIIRGLVLVSPDRFATPMCNSRTRGHSFVIFTRF